MTRTFWLLLKTGHTVERELPAKMKVCSRCEGRGTHVNPAIDGHGLTREDFDADPDFEEGYFSGRYDIRCEECDGRNVVAEPDFKRWNARMTRRYWAFQEMKAADDAEARWEARWCV